MKRIGKQSLRFNNTPIISGAASAVGEKEGEGPLGKYFDLIETDPSAGVDNWEAAESMLQQKALDIAMRKAGMDEVASGYLIGGDLLGQSIATSFSAKNYSFPLFGVYGACSTMGEALILAAVFIDGGYSDLILTVTSSHFASAEKEFRFPLDYGNQRAFSAAWTVTGAGATVVSRNTRVNRSEESDRSNESNENNGSNGSNGSNKSDAGIKKDQKRESSIIITGATPGKIVDYGVKDSMNMGACMAPAACDTIAAHFADTGLNPSHYSRIITGDLGAVGSDILIELLAEKGIDISKNHIDCGNIIYDPEAQDTHAGGSGCGCSAVTFSGYILSKLENREWEKVLFVPTGALLSTVSFNEGNSIPGIAHAVVVEVQ